MTCIRIIIVVITVCARTAV